jgi:uncharacterized membrane protein
VARNRRFQMYLPPKQYIPQFVVNRRPLFVWAVVTTAALTFTSLIVVAPLAQATEHPYLAYTHDQGFSHVCHQMPERSFFITGHQLAVCARCTGLYLGFAAALLFYPFVSSLKRTYTPQRKWLLIAAAPLTIDFALGFFGIWENTHLSRFLTGALLGGVAIFYVIPSLVEVSLRSKSLFAGPERSQRNAMRFNSAGEQITVVPSDYSAPHRRI